MRLSGRKSFKSVLLLYGIFSNDGWKIAAAEKDWKRGTYIFSLHEIMINNENEMLMMIP